MESCWPGNGNDLAGKVLRPVSNFRVRPKLLRVNMLRNGPLAAGNWLGLFLRLTLL